MNRSPGFLMIPKQVGGIDMNVRQLTPEESAALDAKYGKPLGPIGSIRRNPVYPKYPKLNVDRYMEMKSEGMTDKQVCQTIHISSNTLCDLKREWKIKTVANKGRKKKEKQPCKMCGDPEFSTGLCRSHYMKMWRWNH